MNNSVKKFIWFFYIFSIYIFFIGCSTDEEDKVVFPNDLQNTIWLQDNGPSYNKLRFYTNIVEVWDSPNYNGARFQLYRIERNGNYIVDGLDTKDIDVLLFREYSIVGDELFIDENYMWSGIAPKGKYVRSNNLDGDTTPPGEISNLNHEYRPWNNNPSMHSHYFTWTNPNDNDLYEIEIIQIFKDGTTEVGYRYANENPIVSFTCVPNEYSIVFKTVDKKNNKSNGITFILQDQ